MHSGTLLKKHMRVPPPPTCAVTLSVNEGLFSNPEGTTQPTQHTLTQHNNHTPTTPRLCARAFLITIRCPFAVPSPCGCSCIADRD